jgi:hypothetical protein
MLADITDRRSSVSQDSESLTEFRKPALTGRPLGDEPFLMHLEALTGRALRPRKRDHDL